MSKAKEILDHLENVLISEEQITIKYGDKNHSDIAEANKELAELKQSNTWVSVEERLPEPDTNVVCFDGEEVFEGSMMKNWGKGNPYWYKNNSLTSGYYSEPEHEVIMNVKKWQPLPTPPSK